MRTRNNEDLNVHVRVHVFFFFLLVCVQSAPSNPPATLPEEIIHCQYLLTSDCIHRTHTYAHTDTHSRNTLIVRTVTLKCTHTSSNLNTFCHITLHHTAPPTPPPHSVGCTCIQMYEDTHTYTHKTDANTSSISIQGVLHCLSVYDTHAWWPMGAQRPVLLME